MRCPSRHFASELFGYKAGAFTNAVKDKPGHFALAEGGTIFLDEIGDTSPAFQVKLLRVLEEREFLPLGGVKEIAADIRIITATNKDLYRMVEEETFRRDLYYRINVIRLKIPPLRDRMEDVPLLESYFINKFNKIREKSVQRLSLEVLKTLMSHNFPGNIRELENLIEYAFLLCSTGDIELQHMPGYFTSSAPLPSSKTEKNQINADPVKSAEITVITNALKRNHYNRKAAAAELGIHKSTLFRKIHKLGIVLPVEDGRSERT